MLLFMQFGRPTWFWLLALIPALALLLVWAFRARRRALEKFVSQPLVGRLTSTVRPSVRRWKAVLLVVAILFSILALVEPRWGFEWRQVKRKGVDVFVLLDVSKSMLTEDVRPNRLTQAKFAVEDLLGKLEGDRVGLIAFAGTAFVQCPLTVDYEAFRLALKDADTRIIPRGGSAVGLALRTALKGFEAGEGRDRAIVLISDGEETSTDALAAAEEAAKAGARVYAIGVGTTEGDLIPIREPGHPLEYVKNPEGAVVKSRLDESLLKQLALATQGIYVRSVAGDFGMETVYAKGIGQLKHKEVEEQKQKRYFERFQWPLGIALLLLVIEMFLSDRRKTWVRTAVVIGWLGLNLAGSAQAAESPPEVYNKGVHGYQTNDFKSAAIAFEQATAAKDRALQERALYNLGNTLYRMGQAAESQSLDKAKPIYQRSLKSYEDTLALNPQDQDAAFNRNVVKRKIEELEKKQEQQKQQQDQKEQGSQQQDQQKKTGGPQPKEPPDQGQAQNQKPPEQKPEQQSKPQEQQAQEQQPKPEQGQEQKPEERQAQAQPQPANEDNLDKQRAAALLDNLREDEQNWNFFPELQMKDLKDNDAPVKDW